MEVVADGVVDEALLLLGLPPRLIPEHHVLVPPPLDLHTEPRFSNTAALCRPP